MMARYALDTSPVVSYMRDFHGLTQQGTGGTSATCADCHDAHHSLPSSHPDSRMHLSNRGTACGKCHGQASETFIQSFSHKKITPDRGGRIKEIVATLYVLLIVGTIGGMLLHNGVIWSHAVRRKRRYQSRHGRIVRLNVYERVWHWALLLSFGTLAVTGFALKFPESVWYRWMFMMGMTEAIRSWVHRLAGLTLIGSTACFMAYQVTHRFGRRWIVHMWPRWRDVEEFLATARYYLGISKHRPRYGVFNYVEKSEYWALLWGTGIMVLTGLVLWFPKSLPPNTPAWVIDVSRTIHFYEAVLAVLSILVWHFFHTMFRQDEFPMDTTWLTGVLTEEEARHRFTDEAIQAQIPPPPETEVEAPPAPPSWAEEGEQEVAAARKGSDHRD
jgi:cytochrome b subunit of formate dehydrogenase